MPSIIDPPPREARVFDIVVWGATGFTGERVVKQLAAQRYSGSWAIAGRSRTKLLAVLAKLNIPARDVPIIEADTAEYNSLLLLTRQTRLVLACVGPYRCGWATHSTHFVRLHGTQSVWRTHGARMHPKRNRLHGRLRGARYGAVPCTRRK